MPSRPKPCGNVSATASHSESALEEAVIHVPQSFINPKIKRCFMKETGPRDLHETNSARTILRSLARNMRSAAVQRLAARNIILIVAAAALVFAVALHFGVSPISAQRANHDWPNHGNDLANTRFQNLDQINPGNVNKLQVAWVFHTGVLDPLSELEASPIEVGGRLFITDGHDDVFALNAATGQQLWKFDGFNDEAQLAAFLLCCGRNNHGVAYGEATRIAPRGRRGDRFLLACHLHPLIQSIQI
jgi:glucose dehydrogenase